MWLLAVARRLRLIYHLRLTEKKQSEVFLWFSGNESTCKRRRHGFDPWSGKTPSAMEQLSLGDTTIEPGLWSLRTATTEHGCCSHAAGASRTHALQEGQPPQPEARSRHLEKSPNSYEDPAQPKRHKQINKVRVNGSNYIKKNRKQDQASGLGGESWEGRKCALNTGPLQQRYVFSGDGLYVQESLSSWWEKSL